MVIYMDNNICRFVPRKHTGLELHTINFVLETKVFPSASFVNGTLYRMGLVKSGTGQLQIPGDSFTLCKGDLFFCIPNLPYFIESDNDLEYMYISFLGTKANLILEMFNINRQNILFHDFDELIELWAKALESVNTTTLDIRTEGILLYSFSVLGEKLIKYESVNKPKSTSAIIKKYIDDNYFDRELTLEKISRELSYSQKYISSIFKKSFNINFSTYLNTLRIQHACTFMEQNLTSIKDISYMCGFKDQLYFTKVFKLTMGLTPKEYLAKISKA